MITVPQYVAVGTAGVPKRKRKDKDLRISRGMSQVRKQSLRPTKMFVNVTPPKSSDFLLRFLSSVSSVFQVYGFDFALG